MASLSPTQLATLRAAAADPRGELCRTAGGYVGHSALRAWRENATPLPTARHSSRAIYALERFGLLEYVEPGLQSLVCITEPGRRALEAFERAGAIAGAHAA
jgi:hypothetical protein